MWCCWVCNETVVALCRAVVDFCRWILLYLFDSSPIADPLNMTKKQAQAYESQAIGRAYRQGQKNSVVVVRFILRKTIEHKLYLRNNDVVEGDKPVKDTPAEVAAAAASATADAAVFPASTMQQPPAPPAVFAVPEARSASQTTLLGERTGLVRTNSISAVLAAIGNAATGADSPGAVIKAMQQGN